MNIIAQAEQVIHAADKAIDASGQYGLIGVLLVMILIGIAAAVALVFRFLAPIVKEVAASTVSCQATLAQHMVAQTEKMDAHGQKMESISSKADQISEKLNRCPVVSGQFKPV